MGIRSLKSASISTGTKSSKFWDQLTTLTGFESIITAVPSGSSTSITIDNIPQGYKSLHLRINARTNGSGSTNGAVLVYANDALPPYNHFMYQSGANSTFNSGSGTSGYAMNMPTGVAGPAYFGSAIIDIEDYADTNKYKTLINKNGYSYNDGDMFLYSAYWNTMSPITKLTFTSTNGNWNSGSTFALYGIY